MNKEDLENDIQTALDKWDERSMFTLAGVKNLSRSDLDTLLCFCDYYDQYGSLHGLRIYSPPIRNILVIYGML